MRTTLVILAAGIGSRYGGGVKQLEHVGPNGELIIDYSIHDAIAAGFDKIIFIIRKDIEKYYREVIGDRIENIGRPLGVEVRYAFQSLEDAPIPVPEGRKKPWGTGQAILSCEGLLDEPFAVINADDYYGKESFAKAAEFLKNGKYGLVGYILKNTLSENGGVNRGICMVEDGKLSAISETYDIRKTADGAESDGRKLSMDSIVSMNFWCVPESFISELKERFPVFLSAMSDPLKDEYLLSDIIDSMLKEGAEVSVLLTAADWFGMTYKEDKARVISGIRKLYDLGAYNRNDLYGDLLFDAE